MAERSVNTFTVFQHKFTDTSSNVGSFSRISIKNATELRFGHQYKNGLRTLHINAVCYAIVASKDTAYLPKLFLYS